MFGRERDQAGVIIEPKLAHSIDVNDHKQLSELRNKLWCVHLYVQNSFTLKPMWN